MEKWQWTALLLCGFGFFKEFRPSEPFFTEFAIECKNITQEVLVHDAYPVSTYSYLGTLAIVFLVTDFLRYRSVVILEGLAYVITWTILIWGKGLPWFMMVEVFYGLACSTEVAYYTYIYAKVNKENYKKVTSYTYSAILTGRFAAGVVAQLLMSYELIHLCKLNYISLTSVSIGFVLTLFLPSVHESIYFYRNDNDIINDNNIKNINISTNHHIIELNSSTTLVDKNTTNSKTTTKLNILKRIQKTYPILWKDFKLAYSNLYILKWSIWWAIATAGHLQIINYIQALWEVISFGKDETIYNGAVEAIQCALSAILAFSVGYVKLPWFKLGETFLCIISLLQGGSLILMSETTNLYVAYICYILFRTCFQVTITVASAEVAQGISEDSYGLIFGINTFLALTIQTILTVIVADSAGLALKERPQFFVYGCFYIFLGIVFICFSIYTFYKFGCNICSSNNNNSNINNGTTSSTISTSLNINEESNIEKSNNQQQQQHNSKLS